MDRPALVDEATRAMGELNEAWRVISSADQSGTRTNAAAGSRDSSESNELRAPVEGECDMCGSTPAARVNLHGTRGLLLARTDLHLEPDLCRPCGRSMFREVQSDTLTRGWWGITAAIVNVGCVVSNVFAILSHQRRLPPPSGRDPHVLTPFPPGIALARPVFRRAGPVLSTGILVGLVAWFVVAAAGTPSAGDPQTPAGTHDEKPPAISPVGSCLTQSGAVADCAGPTAAYEIVEQVSDASQCGAFEVFTSASGEVFCAQGL